MGYGAIQNQYLPDAQKLRSLYGDVKVQITAGQDIICNRMRRWIISACKAYNLKVASLIRPIHQIWSAPLALTLSRFTETPASYAPPKEKEF